MMVNRRTQAWVRIVLFGAAMLVCAISPLAASAAEVVDLRIGVHPDYTRVVFELDRPTSYRVLQGNGQSELVVRLEANSISRKIKSSNSLIGLIQIEPTATGSKARIALARDGLNLKEMILANPPRIVLDVIVPKAEIAKAPVAAPKATASPRLAAPKALAKAAAPSKPAKIIAAVAPTQKASAKAAPKPTAKPVAQEKAAPIPTLAPALKQPPRPAPPPAAPVAAASTPNTNPIKPDDSTAWAKQIFAMVGLVAVLVAWVMVRRQRGRIPLPTRERTEGLGDLHEAEAANPFAERSLAAEEATLSDLEEPAAVAETEALIDDAPEISGGIVTASSDTQPPPTPEPRAPGTAEPAPAAVDVYAAAEEAVALARGFEEKIRVVQEQLEEALASRERIERQMAAQNEELRVQRAAIARTQRAVRNISRPEEDNHGDVGAPAAD